jgi:hypothetical protein
MNMKDHIIAGLGDVFERWNALLGRLSEEQITAPMLPSRWSIKDQVAHLMAWQQRSIARCEAALSDQPPTFPDWPVEIDPEEVDNTDQINNWIYTRYSDQTWEAVYSSWREGFQRFLDLAEKIPEKYLLDNGKYSWLPFPLVLILLGSYDHHQEHLETLEAWLEEHGIE